MSATPPMPTPGSSRQDYGTPQEFLLSVKTLLQITSFWKDLAASPENAVASRYYTVDNDALLIRNGWESPYFGWNWLNMPFRKIEPWVEKAHQTESVGNHAVLVPASVGSAWWRKWVHRKATVLFLEGRLTFVGEIDPYPKDCALLLYPFGKGLTRFGSTVHHYNVWDWRKKEVYLA